jgi:hypothetical protein
VCVCVCVKEGGGGWVGDRERKDACDTVNTMEAQNVGYEKRHNESFPFLLMTSQVNTS